MSWLTTTAVSTTRTWSTRWFTKLQRIHEIIKPLTEQLVNFSNNANQLSAVKMALHHIDHILNQ